VYAWPLAVIVVTLFLSGGNRFLEAAGHTSRFTSTAHAAAVDREGRPGAQKSMQAVLDLVSDDNDALLAWDEDPSIYTRFHRVPATRFQQRYFVVGQIYAGQRNEDFILPNTWDWIEDDLEESKPDAFIETTLPLDDERFEELVEDRFAPVYDGAGGTLHLTPAAADALLEGAGETEPLEVVAQDAPGWTINGDDIAYAADPVVDNKVTLTQGRCQRIEGTARTPDIASNVGFEIRISDAYAVESEVRLVLDGANASSKDPNDGVFDQRELSAPARFVRFAVVIGIDSAALIVDDQVVAAMKIPSVPVIAMESLRTSLEVTNLTTSPALTLGQC